MFFKNKAAVEREKQNAAEANDYAQRMRELPVEAYHTQGVTQASVDSLGDVAWGLTAAGIGGGYISPNIGAAAPNVFRQIDRSDRIRLARDLFVESYRKVDTVIFSHDELASNAFDMADAFEKEWLKRGG